VDLNNDGGQQPGEPMYLQQAACGVASVGAGDIRLTTAFGKVGGTVVTGADDDLSRNTIGAVGWGYKYFDADGNGAYNPGDIVYVGLGGPVAINNVAVNGPNAFTRVTTTSPNYNSPACAFAVGVCAPAAVTAIGANELFFNTDGIAGYGVGDTVYLQLVPGPGAGPAVGDIRLTALSAALKGGSTVTGSDVDVTVTLLATVPAGGTCFVDNNGDTFLSAGEPLYIQFTTPGCGVNSVASGDYRVLATSGKQGGTLVSGSDDDFSRNTIPTPASAIMFFDADGSTAYSNMDPIFLHFGAGTTVVVNDVMLSGASHNTQVTSSTSGLNNGLLALPLGGLGSIGTFNADAVGAAAVVTTGDFLYVNTGAAFPATPAVGLLRLVKVGSFAPGSYVAGLDADAKVAPGATPHTAFCYIDVNADAIQNPTEPAYLVTAGGCAGGVTALAVRMTAVAPYQAGTIVKGSDDDFSRGLATPAAPGAWAIYDQDASAAYTNQEPIYVDFGGLVVTPNDVAVTVNQFVRVTSSTAGINSPLIVGPAVGGELFGETDGIAGFSSGDVVYVDMDASGTITVGDVRLTAAGNNAGQIGGDVGDNGGIGGGSGTLTSTGTATSTVTSTGTSTVTGTTTAPATTPPVSTPPTSSSSTKSNTPGFELVALVGALAVALVLVRRKL
jgi:hypothetical protein